MKKMFVALLVFVLLAAAVTPALAAGNTPNKGRPATPPGQTMKPAVKHVAPKATPAVKKVAPKATVKQQAPKTKKAPNPRAAFVFSGSITAIGGNTITVEVTKSNQITRRLLGDSTTVTLTTTVSQTRLLMWTAAGTQHISIADLQVGQNVMCQGRVTNDIWTAQWVKVALGTARRTPQLP
jgi:hypothetical protein